MNTIKEEILALRSDDGMWHGDQIHDWAASNPKSKLHERLEWDDSLAGREYRLIQIRNLIRIHVVNEVGETKLVSLRYDRPRGGGYRDIDVAAKIPSLASLMLRDALADLQRVRERYRRITKLASVWIAIDSATEAASADEDDRPAA